MDPRRYVVLYQDEASFYRQPTQAWLWCAMGRRQPKMHYACAENTLMRVVGYLNAASGALHAMDMPSVTVKRLAQTIEQLPALYPDAESISVVWDNWPNHKHAIVTGALRNHPQIHLIWLPTYAPWLNKIEKVWRLIRQHLTHAHPWSDHFGEFKNHVRAELASLSGGGPEIMKYVGLST